MEAVAISLIIMATTPKESLRFQYTMEQGCDTSCGISVVATALDRYSGMSTDGVELIGSALGDTLDEGYYTVSLVDMARVFEERDILWT